MNVDRHDSKESFKKSLLQTDYSEGSFVGYGSITPRNLSTVNEEPNKKQGKFSRFFKWVDKKLCGGPASQSSKVPKKKMQKRPVSTSAREKDPEQNL